MFLGVQVTVMFQWVWQISPTLQFTALYMVQVRTLNMGSRKNMVWVLPIAGCSMGSQLPLQVISVALAGLIFSELLILFELFRVIIVLNYLEGLQNTLRFEWQGLNSTWNRFWIAWGGGGWTQMLYVLLYNLVAGHITCNTSSRTCYIACLCNMLCTPVIILYSPFII